MEIGFKFDIILYLQELLDGLKRKIYLHTILVVILVLGGRKEN
jgi:hypothetical protein